MATIKGLGEVPSDPQFDKWWDEYSARTVLGWLGTRVVIRRAAEAAWWASLYFDTRGARDITRKEHEGRSDLSANCRMNDLTAQSSLADKRDAERYRWWRKRWCSNVPFVGMEFCNPTDEGAFDKNIDDAIATANCRPNDGK